MACQTHRVREVKLGQRRAAALKRAARLRPTDFFQAIAVAALLVRAEVSLRMLPIDRVTTSFGMRFDEKPTTSSGRPAWSPAEHRWLGNADRVIRRWPFDRSCLRRSLVLGWILRKRRPQLVIGTLLVGGKVTAHAWVRVGTTDLDTDIADHVTFH